MWGCPWTPIIGKNGGKKQNTKVSALVDISTTSFRKHGPIEKAIFHS